MVAFASSCSALGTMLWAAYTWMPVALLGIPFVTVTLYRHSTWNDMEEASILRYTRFKFYPVPNKYKQRNKEQEEGLVVHGHWRLLIDYRSTRTHPNIYNTNPKSREIVHNSALHEPMYT